MTNPAKDAVEKAGGPSLVAHVLGISRQAVNSWFSDAGIPVYLIRTIAAVSGVPVEKFLAFEESKKGINVQALAKKLREAAEDRAGT